MWTDFKSFLLKQNVLSLAVAFVVGVALNAVVKALVDDFIMPFVGAITPKGTWQAFVWQVGGVKFGVGDFLAAILNFIVIGIVAWRLSKLVPAPASGPATKGCTFCFSTIDARATRCPECTSALTA
jgi:large conductance mechanosensitive channel